MDEEHWAVVVGSLLVLSAHRAARLLFGQSVSGMPCHDELGSVARRLNLSCCVQLFLLHSSTWYPDFSSGLFNGACSEAAVGQCASCPVSLRCCAIIAIVSLSTAMGCLSLASLHPATVDQPGSQDQTGVILVARKVLVFGMVCLVCLWYVYWHAPRPSLVTGRMPFHHGGFLGAVMRTRLTGRYVGLGFVAHSIPAPWREG